MRLRILLRGAQPALWIAAMIALSTEMTIAQSLVRNCDGNPCRAESRHGQDRSFERNHRSESRVQRGHETRRITGHEPNRQTRPTATRALRDSGGNRPAARANDLIGTRVNLDRSVWLDQPSAHGLSPLRAGLGYLHAGDAIYIVDRETAQIIAIAAVTGAILSNQ